MHVSWHLFFFSWEHLGKQHRETFCWSLLRSLMMKNHRQWLMCQNYNNQKTRRIITII
ncbi:hypothetical protein PAHAL_1G170100 [Panicum hallii]|uniref:Uncharacterized protein n=1 Tax=Panicum hallii TaxID=206008 RepID=A0A2S3GNV2_9POAL|nr:hypothetical protein PAHAL_1G170100 [Panicum hallii]